MWFSVAKPRLLIYSLLSFYGICSYWLIGLVTAGVKYDTKNYCHPMVHLDLANVDCQKCTSPFCISLLCAVQSLCNTMPDACTVSWLVTYYNVCVHLMHTFNILAAKIVVLHYAVMWDKVSHTGPWGPCIACRFRFQSSVYIRAASFNYSCNRLIETKFP